MAGPGLGPRAHGLERFDVRCDRAARRKIAAWRREVRAAPAREQRTEKQHRAAKAADERRIRLVFRQRLALHAEGRRPDAVHLRAEVLEQARHAFDVADPRNIREHALFRGEQTGREQWQRGVLVAFNFDRTREAASALNQQR